MKTRLSEGVTYQEGSITSKVIMKTRGGNVTLFAFSRGEELSEHTAPFDALVQCLEGEVDVVLGGESNRLEVGEAILMPAGIPHAVRAISDMKMLLTMVRE